jgi:membrane protease YdiL (CAAX protease family)
MSRFSFGVLWLVALLAAGAALGHRFIPQGFFIAPYELGAAAGGMVFFTLAGLNWLPGARAKRGAPVEWGWRQAVWMLVQFGTMQLAGQVLCMLVLVVGGIIVGRATHTAPANNFAGGRLIAATIAGYLAAAAWSFWYIGRLGPARIKDGAVTGIGWQGASWKAYLAAVGGLVLVGLISVLVQHVAPPPPDAMKNNPLQQIFGTHGWGVVALFVLAAAVAPLTEELVFRGGVLSALAGPCGTIWAAVITTVLFTAAHAEEYVFYLPGLFVIGAVAVVLMWLRITFKSIRPGILLHVLFNGLSIIAVAFQH